MSRKALFRIYPTKSMENATTAILFIWLILLHNILSSVGPAGHNLYNAGLWPARLSCQKLP